MALHTIFGLIIHLVKSSLIVIAFIFITANSFGQLNYNWHGSIKGWGDDIVEVITVDSNNNFYIGALKSSQTVDIDLGSGTYNLTTAGSASFIAKYDSSGQLLMSILITSLVSGSISFKSIYVDNNGFIYVSGNFQGCNDFDPGPGLHDLCSNLINAFIAKYSPSGNLIYAKRLSSGLAYYGVSIETATYDTQGNGLMAIASGGYIYLDSILLPISTVPSSEDLNILEFDTSGNLTHYNLIDAPALGVSLLPWDIRYDHDGNYLLGGFIYGPGCVIGNPPNNCVSSIIEGGIVVKLKPTGECIYIAEFASVVLSSLIISGITPLSSGRTAFVGYFGEPFDADPGPGVINLTPGSQFDIFYGVLDSLGGLIYVHQIAGNSASMVLTEQILSDSYDNYFITGNFTYALNNNPVVGIPAHTAIGSSDEFIARFDQDGNCGFIMPIEGDSICSFNTKMAFSGNNKLLYTGSFVGVIDLDPDLGIKTDTSFSFSELFVVNYSLRDNPQIPSSYYRVSGTLYHDANMNGIRDPGELPLPGQLMEIQPGNLFTLTDQNGFYMKYMGAGTYTVKPVAFTPPVGTNFICLPATHTATLSAINVHDTGNDFGVSSLSSEHELEVVITPVAPFQSLNPSTIRITGKNNFFYNDSVQLQLGFNSLINFQYTSVPYDSLTGSLVKWSFPAIPPFSSKSVNTTFIDTVIFAPDSVIFSAFVGPILNDWIPANNYDTIHIPVMGSNDPNLKVVNPSGDLKTNQIQDTVTLDYTIYFQNTGQAPAWRVIVIDTLSPLFEIGSLRIIDQSHSCLASLEHGNVLVFRFNNINLPDSATNETASHGFVRFRIQPKNNLQVGTVIENSAAIIFDFNQPVITNTVTNLVTLPVMVEEQAIPDEIKVYPTLTGDKIYIDWNGFRDRNIAYSLSTSTGKIIFSNKKGDPNSNLLYHFINENSGVYILTITTDERKYMRKILLLK